MLVASTVLPLTMILGLPLASALGDDGGGLGGGYPAGETPERHHHHQRHHRERRPRSGGPGSPGPAAGCTGDRFWVNVTRRVDGDALTSACPRCGDLCRQARAVRLRCDLREYPCTCRCPRNQTFRTDLNLCVDAFQDCKSLLSPEITFLDFPQAGSPNISPAPAPAPAPAPVPASPCRVRAAQALHCDGWRDLGSILNVTDRGAGALWMVATGTDSSAGRNVWWTGSREAFQSLSGFVLNLDIICTGNNHVTTSCLHIKMAGTRGYAVSIGGPSTPPSALGWRGSEETTEGATAKWPVTGNSTGIGNDAGELSAEEYRRLEMMVTAVCLGVALLLCVWLTCFALEKRIQSKKRGSEKQFASQTRTYTHEVSHCRKTLMDVYDMPMIRFNASKSGSGEEDDSSGGHQTGPPPPKKKTDKEASEPARTEHEAEADGEESTSPSSSSEQRLETGSSSETLESETTAGPATYSGVPAAGAKNSGDQEFKNWRPCAKQLPASSSLSPTKRRVPPGILKKSPNTSPTRSPSRSPPLPRRSPTKKGILVKRSPTVPKRWRAAVSRHLQHAVAGSSSSAAAAGASSQQPTGDSLELRTVNGPGSDSASPPPPTQQQQQQQQQQPKRSILKHGARWRALAPKLAPIVAVAGGATTAAPLATDDADGDDACTDRNNHHPQPPPPHPHPHHVHHNPRGQQQHVVIKCEIHHEDERRELTDGDSDEKAYTERSPLTKSIKMVLDSVPSKKNCIEWRREEYETVPCTDV